LFPELSIFTNERLNEKYFAEAKANLGFSDFIFVFSFLKCTVRLRTPTLGEHCTETSEDGTTIVGVYYVCSGTKYDL